MSRRRGVPKWRKPYLRDVAIPAPPEVPVTARDSGAAGGTPPRPLPAACANCGHSASIHRWNDGHRTSCTKGWGTGRCFCNRYTVPKEET